MRIYHNYVNKPISDNQDQKKLILARVLLTHIPIHQNQITIVLIEIIIAKKIRIIITYITIHMLQIKKAILKVEIITL